jgi:hypothetical protein
MATFRVLAEMFPCDEIGKLNNFGCIFIVFLIFMPNRHFIYFQRKFMITFVFNTKRKICVTTHY